MKYSLLGAALCFSLALPLAHAKPLDVNTESGTIRVNTIAEGLERRACCGDRHREHGT